MTSNSEGGRLVGTVPGEKAVFERTRGFFIEIADLRDKCSVLQKDSERCIKAAQKHSQSQFWRRMLVKNLFAWFEGTVYGMKRLVLRQSQRKEVEFSIAELAMLREEKYELDSQSSEAVTRATNYPKFTVNLRFAFRCLAKSCEAAFSLDEGIVPELKQFEGLRNRLTHPKKASDLEVTRGEFGLCVRVNQWFATETSRLFQKCNVDKPQNRQLVSPSTPTIQIQEPYAVLLSDGRVFEFRKLRDAKAFAYQNRNADKALHPLLIRTSNLLK